MAFYTRLNLLDPPFLVRASGGGGPPPPACGVFTPGDETNPFTGNVFLTSDADIATFAAGVYDAVLGDLTIDDSGTGNITSLVGLESLAYVSGDVTIRNNTVLTTLDGLDGLLRIGNVSGGDFDINNNTALTDILATYSLSHVNADFVIRNNPLVTNMDNAYPCLNYVGVYDDTFGEGLFVHDMAGLVSMNSAFPILTQADRLWIYNNPVLVTVNDLAPLLITLPNEVDEDECFLLRDCPLLVEAKRLFASATNVTTPNFFDDCILIRDNPLLVDVDDAFAALTTGLKGKIVFEFCGSSGPGLKLTTIFEALSSFNGALEFNSNKIQTAPIFPALTTIVGNAGWQFDSNTGTIDLSGSWPVLLNANVIQIQFTSNPGLTKVYGMFAAAFSAPLVASQLRFGANFAGNVNLPSCSQAQREIDAIVAGGFAGTTFNVQNKAPFTPGEETNPFVGNVLLASNSDVVTFAAGGYDAILGDLTVSGTATSLGGLDALMYVSGTMLIDSNLSLSSIAGLASLAAVGADMTITNNPLLIMDDALPCLNLVVGTVTISGNGS